MKRKPIESTESITTEMHTGDAGTAGRACEGKGGMRKFIFQCLNENGVPVDVVRHGRDLSDAMVEFWNDGYARWRIWNCMETK